MADTTNQQVDRLKSQIDTGAQEAKSYLDKLKKSVEEFDREHGYSHRATEFLNSGISAAESSVDELKHVSSQLSEKSKDASEQSMEMAHKTLENVKYSLNAVQDKAREYDQKFMGSKGSQVADSVSSSLESIANTTRQRTTDAIEMASEQLTRMKDSMQNAASSAGKSAQVVTGEALRVGDKVDEKLGVSEKASGAAGIVTETVKNLDKRMHVTETAAMIDSKVTGGLGARVVNKGVEIVQESIEYVTETLQQAKIAATKSDTAQAVDKKADSAIESASSTVGAAQERVIGAKDQAVGMACQARESAMDAVGVDKDAPMTEEMKQGAYNAKDKAYEKAGDVKEGAQQMAGSAQQKGSEMKESAKQKGNEMAQMGSDMAGAAQRKGSEMKESAKQGAQYAKDKTEETAASAQQQGHEAKENVKEKASEASNKAQESGKQYGSQQSPSVYESMKETAQDIGTGAKEAMFGMSSGESATDQKYKQQHRGEGIGAGQVGEVAVEIKDTTGNTMSRQKGIMKDATKA